MKPNGKWSYAPYAPPLYHVGTPYINRVVPYETSVHIEWKSEENEEYRVYLGLKDEEPMLVDTTDKCEYDFAGLKENVDYCFKVACSKGESRLRLARTGKRDDGGGVTVNYLHPDDEVYAFSGRYLCSPSLVRAPQGHLLTSMDLFAPGTPQNLTLIFKSEDEGQSWHWLSELFPCFWGKLFVHRGRLYMTGASTEYGDLLIGASDDGGRSFTEPTVLLRGACHSRENGVHKNPQPVVEYGGRLWNTCEWGTWARSGHAAMVFSCDADADLLDPASWSLSEPVPYDPNWAGTAEGKSAGNIEGSLVTLRDGGLYNIMRYDMLHCEPDYGRVLAYRVNTSDPEAPLEYSHAIELNGNHSKFEIKYDEKSDCYYTIISRIRASKNKGDRNLLSLMVSRDAEHWRLARDLIDATNKDPKYTGFQYVDFMLEGEDLLYLCRTAANNAHNYHDANYSVFNRVERFRRYAIKDI